MKKFTVFIICALVLGFIGVILEGAGSRTVFGAADGSFKKASANGQAPAAETVGNGSVKGVINSGKPESSKMGSSRTGVNDIRQDSKKVPGAELENLSEGSQGQGSNDSNGNYLSSGGVNFGGTQGDYTNYGSAGKPGVFTPGNTTTPGNGKNGGSGSKTSTEKEAQKVVYLTFDDGPNKALTPKVLQILDQYNVKATFFVIGTMVEQNPELFKEVVRRGHGIGNHTYSHRYEDVYKSQTDFLNSLKKNDLVINSAAGVQTKIYRDPGGKLRTNMEYQSFLAQNGYVRGGWNVESYDSRSPRHSSERIYGDIVQQVEGRRDLWGNMVILMHDSSTHENTVAALPKIIEYLQKKGFIFKTMQ